METIGFIGLGAMGSRMAQNLVKQGYQLQVYNRSLEACQELEALGARAVSSPREAAKGAHYVISMVRDDEASRQVWLDPERGALHGLARGACAIESSTLTSEWVTSLAQAVEHKNACFLEAPVVGSRPQAQSAQLIYLTGGEPSAFEYARPVLNNLGCAVHHLGPVGAGTRMKLAVNALFGIQVAAWGETLSWLERAGTPIQLAVELLNSLPTTSPALQGVGKLMATGNEEPLFPISLVVKDLGYANQMLLAAGAASPILETVTAQYRKADSAGWGGKNIVAVKGVFD